jgi:hypothetical protein
MEEKIIYIEERNDICILLGKIETYEFISLRRLNLTESSRAISPVKWSKDINILGFNSVPIMRVQM